jgi:hypothetical protein
VIRAEKFGDVDDNRWSMFALPFQL